MKGHDPLCEWSSLAPPLTTCWQCEAIARVREDILAELIPRVSHKGPNDTDLDLLLGAARKMASGYPPGGMNVTNAVVALINSAAHLATHTPGRPVEPPLSSHPASSATPVGSAGTPSIYDRTR